MLHGFVNQITYKLIGNHLASLISITVIIKYKKLRIKLYGFIPFKFLNVINISEYVIVS